MRFVFYGMVNPLLHNIIFWHLWNIMYLTILWKMEHLLLLSKSSILHNIFKSIQSYNKIFWIFQCCLKIENDVMI